MAHSELPTLSGLIIGQGFVVAVAVVLVVVVVVDFVLVLTSQHGFVDSDETTKVRFFASSVHGTCFLAKHSPGYS